MNKFVTPILFIIFNREESTRRVFGAIKELRPKQLFIAADGPRDIAGEVERCVATRAIIEQIDWDCQVELLFREKNLGCRLAVSSAIDWFFSQVEQGIILEDDCLPEQSFFWFCQELLERYKDNERIMHISGNNFQKHKIKDSYYFSQISHIWGWATWRRAWHRYDIKIKTFPDFVKKETITKIFPKKIQQRFWLNVLNRNYLGLDSNWDYQWAYTLLNNHGLAIHPKVNLVSNIGFGAEASHSFNPSDSFANWSTGSLNFPLKHPTDIIVDKRADDFVMRHNLGATYYDFGLKQVLKKIGVFDFFKRAYYFIRKIS